jgi:hypothetical protein
MRAVLFTIARGVDLTTAPECGDPVGAGPTAPGFRVAHDGPAPTYTSLPAAFTTAPAEDTRRRATGVAAGARTDGARVAAKLLVDLAGGERSHQPG